jgi:hypothetical protein
MRGLRQCRAATGTPVAVESEPELVGWIADGDGEGRYRRPVPRARGWRRRVDPEQGEIVGYLDDHMRIVSNAGGRLGKEDHPSVLVALSVR